MLRGLEPEKRAEAEDELDRLIRVDMTPDPNRDPDAPTWWISDDEAYVSSMGAVRSTR